MYLLDLLRVDFGERDGIDLVLGSVAEDDDGRRDDGVGHQRADGHELDQLLYVEDEGHNGAEETPNAHRHQRQLLAQVIASLS